MKYLLYLSLIILFSGCISSRYTGYTFPDPFEFKTSDTVAGTKDSLFNKASRWVRQILVNENESIKMHDKKRGKITAIGFMGSSSTLCMLTCVPNNYNVQYTISIITQDGGYKFTMSNYVLYRKIVSERDSTMVKTITLDKQKHPSSVNHTAWTNLKDDCYKNSQKLMQSFKEYMRSSPDNH